MEISMTPKIALNFTTGVLDPVVNYTRGSVATRVDENGLVSVVSNDQPRFDYNPLTLSVQGLLIEDSRSNLLAYSEQFNDASWGKFAITVTANATIAPSGALTADAVTLDATNAIHEIYKTFTSVSGTTYTGSYFVKAGTHRYVQLLGPGAVFTQWANFDLQTGTRTAGTTGVGQINSFGNGWYRISLSAAAASSSSVARISLSLIPSGTSARATSFTGDGVSNIYVWGAQLEAGAFATSYIPTTTTALTRNADVASITGTNFSDWWQASKGGVLVRARPGTVSGVCPWLQFDDGTANEIIALRGNTTNPELYIVDGGTPQAQIDAGTIAANTDYNLTGWWATNDCKARLDSGAVVTDTTATIPTVTQARLGSDGTNYLNGHLASISYYDTFSSQIYTRRKNKAVFSLL